MSYVLKIKFGCFFKALALRFGYQISRFPKLEGPYERIQVKSFYAPWKEDREFNHWFSVVQAHSLVDQHRCYELWDLVAQTAKLKGALMEVGVWRGGTGALMAKKAVLSGISEHVYLCDTFTGVVKASEKDDVYKGQEHSDTSMNVVQDLIKRMGLTNVHLLQGIFPEETGAKIKQESFRFCHVDVDVYDSAQGILEWVWPRLVVGGVVVFDDYGFPSCKGIRDFVNERKELPDRLCFHNLNGHAIWVKLRS